MKKHILALFCALFLLLGAVPSAAALEGESLRAADTLAALNIVRGDYGLDAPATRAHAAVLLVRLAGAESKAAPITSRSPYYAAPAYARNSIAYAAGQGWITSLSAQSYRPDALVTADAWCSMLLRILGYSDKAGDFAPSGAATFARRIGLLTQPLSGPLTRGQLFQSMRDALTFPCKDGSGTVVEHLVAQGAVSRATANALGLLTPELTARQAADRRMAAVFCLDTYETQKEIDAGEPSANASGFFISPDGLAVTNYHSIADSICATATLATGEVYPVQEVVWYDPGMDLAVLRVSRTSLDGEASTSAFACLELAGTDDIRAGDTVYTLGNPLGLGLAVSSGIISATARDVERYALPCVMNTADISRGSSGGALLNVYGRVIAVTSGAYTYGNNMYLAVPVDPVMDADLTVPGKTLAEVAKLEAAKAND